MAIFLDDISSPKIAQLLNAGKVGVLRTDTLYGVLAKAGNEQAVNKVYELKDRSEHKSPIVLISSSKDLFDTPPAAASKVISESWPGPVSLILPSQQAPLWIRRSNNSVAYRLPANQQLQELLLRTGPLIAPSANPEGEAPAMNVQQAFDYFGDKIDFYVDGGQLANAKPSRLILVNENGASQVLR